MPAGLMTPTGMQIQGLPPGVVAGIPPGTPVKTVTVMVPMSIEIPDDSQKKPTTVLLRGSASSKGSPSRFLASLLHKVHGKSGTSVATAAEEACDCPCAQQAYVQHSGAPSAGGEAVYASVEQRRPQPQAYHYNLPGLAAAPATEPMEF